MHNIGIEQDAQKTARLSCRALAFWVWIEWLADQNFLLEAPIKDQILKGYVNDFCEAYGLSESDESVVFEHF